jgi:deoxyribose-phosphate aldolase
LFGGWGEDLGKAREGRTHWEEAFVANKQQLQDLTDKEIIKLCEICSEIGIAYVKTSTGYGFVKQANGDYNYKGATIPHLEMMQKHLKGDVKIKAAGGVRTLDDLLRMRALGVARVGATATAAILDEAVKRGIGKERVEVAVPPFP